MILDPFVQCVDFRSEFLWIIIDASVLFLDELIELGIEESNDFRGLVVDDFLCLFVV